MSIYIGFSVYGSHALVSCCSFNEKVMHVCDLKYWMNSNTDKIRSLTLVERQVRLSFFTKIGPQSVMTSK